MTGLLAGAVADLSGREGDTEAALLGARRGPLDTSVLANRRERAPNEPQALGPVVTSGAAKVGLGEHVDAHPARGRVEDVVLDEPPQGPEPEVFLRYINARRAALAACYERALKYDRALKGRLTVHLTVGVNGRAREVSVAQDSLASPQVASCVEGLIRGWVFPVRPEEEVPLQFPVLFTPAAG